MKLFQPNMSTRSPRHEAIYALWEVAYTIVDFLAAMLFLIGSVMFFYASLQTPAIWCFVIGSVCFALKPTIRLSRELHYLSIGDVEDLAARVKDRM
ncbi:MAG: YrhK family protein [Pseudomonadota bacterium]